MIQSMTGLSQATLVDFRQYTRQLVINAIDESKEVIGGPSIIVAVNESKFSCKKCNRGHHLASKKLTYTAVGSAKYGQSIAK